MKRVVQFSGGLCSYFAAKRVWQKHGPDEMILLFADTLIESEGLYTFIEAARDTIGAPLIRIFDGRTPWQVFKDERFLGNARVDLCSRILKRELCRKWVEKHCDPIDTILYVGITWDEGRLPEIQERWKPWKVEAPLCDPPFETKETMIKAAKNWALPVSRAYLDGFSHDNCGGGCVKAGQAHFAKLYQIRPKVYAVWERNEQEMREYLGKDVSILKDRRGGNAKPLTLKDFRKRLECGWQFDKDELGGCGCGV